MFFFGEGKGKVYKKKREKRLRKYVQYCQVVCCLTLQRVLRGRGFVMYTFSLL